MLRNVALVCWLGVAARAQVGCLWQRWTRQHNCARVAASSFLSFTFYLPRRRGISRTTFTCRSRLRPALPPPTVCPGGCFPDPPIAAAQDRGVSPWLFSVLVANVGLFNRPVVEIKADCGYALRRGCGHALQARRGATHTGRGAGEKVLGVRACGHEKVRQTWLSS